MATGTRELLALRHAKSAWDAEARTDYDRPLARRGERDAPRIGGWIREHGLAPRLIISSPARRAQQTTERVAEELDLDDDAIRWDERVYGGGVGDLLATLAEHAARGPARVMLVGHNPGLEDLVEHLAAGELPAPPGRKSFPTGALARLRLPRVWSDLEAGAGELIELIRPRALA